MIKTVAALLANFHWMTLNVFLAVLGPVLCYATLHSKLKILKLVFLFLWILFIPNSIYLLTDIHYLPIQLAQLTDVSVIPALLLEYASLIVIGVLTYLLGLMPFEVYLVKRYKRIKGFLICAIVVLNFVIAFGVVLGKLQRRNSWEVFTNLPRLIHDCFVILATPEAIIFLLSFGLITNAVYFFFRKWLIANSIVLQIAGVRPRKRS